MKIIIDLIEIFFGLNEYSLGYIYGYFFDATSNIIDDQYAVQSLSVGATSLTFITFFVIWIIVFYQIIKFFVRKVVDLIC